LVGPVLTPTQVGDFSVTAARHKHVLDRPPRRRVSRFLIPAAAATLVTGTVVGISVASPGGPRPVAARPAPVHVTVTPGDSAYLADRSSLASRSFERTTLTALPKVTGHKFLLTKLNVWPQPREHGKPLTVLDTGSQVAVTGVLHNGFAQVVIDRQVRWVNATYLADKMPKPKPAAPSASATPTGGISDAPCPVSSNIESGLLPGADRIYRAVCALFPQVKEYGGYRPDGEHSHGQAVDIMVYNDSATGQQVADWLQAHASELNIYDIIWQQHIWTPVRASEGWRMMPDRGSPTANHMDHVHVAVNY
jgi:hypothetical protein